MKTRLQLTLLSFLLLSPVLQAEGTYSNAPAGQLGGHENPPPPAGNTRFSNTSRVPAAASTIGPAKQGLPPALQGSDAVPFSGVPDVSGEPPLPPATGNSQPPPISGTGGVSSQPAGVVGAQEPIAPAPTQPPPSGPLQLVEVFSVEQNPGQGHLDYTRAGTTERIDFGAVAGHFAVGMVFRGDYLPDQLGRDFKQKNVIQIAFGTLRSHLQGQTPQFGSLSVIADSMVEFSSRYALKLPSGHSSKPETGGLMLFTSPNSPVEQSDEEKLKSTYFAQTGGLDMKPLGKAKILDIRAQGRRLTYRQQLMQLTINAKLVTPFNATEATLTGSVEFPIYFSEDRAGDILAKQIARESFGVAGSITVLDDPSDSKRELATSKKKKANQKKKKVKRENDDDPGM